MASSISASTTSTTALTLSGDTTGILELKTGATPTTALTIDGSQNVGIGTSSPVERLQSSRGIAATGANQSVGSLDGFVADYSSGISRMFASRNGVATGTMAFWTTDSTGTAAERMRIDSSGNVGIGVVPNAWGSSWKTLSFNTVGALAATTGVTRLYHNAFNNDSANVYRTTAAASMYSQDAGTHQWFYAGSGTAGTNISFTEAMRIDSSGNVGIGTSSPNGRLEVVSTSAGANTNTLFLTNASSNASTATSLVFGVSTDPVNRAAVIRGINAGGNAINLAFLTSNGGVPAEVMRITPTGEALVGVTSLASGFSSFAQIEASGSSGGIVINSTAGNLCRLIFTKGNATGNEGLIRYDTSGYSMQFFTDATERMRITSGGNLLVGTTTALERVTVAGKVSAHTFYGGGQVVTCAVVNTWYKVQDGYFGLYVFRDGSLGGNVVLVFDGTAGATIISNTVTTFEARNNGGNLEIRVTSSAPRQFYWVCLSSVPS